LGTTVSRVPKGSAHGMLTHCGTYDKSSLWLNPKKT
jgi:hypothetical protein